ARRRAHAAAERRRGDGRAREGGRGRAGRAVGGGGRRARGAAPPRRAPREGAELIERRAGTGTGTGTGTAVLTSAGDDLGRARGPILGPRTARGGAQRVRARPRGGG